MAENESGSEKTEQPTAKKLSEARTKGNIPKSTDLNNALGLIVSMTLLLFFGNTIHQRMLAFTKSCYREMADAQVSYEWFLAEAPKWLELLILIVAPFFATLALVTIILTMAQVGLNFTLKPFEPDFSKILNPIQGLLKLLKRDSWVRLIMAIIKTVLITVIAWSVITTNMTTLASLGGLSLGTIFSTLASLTYELGVKMALAMLVLALIDFQYQKFSNTETLKMTKEEVKEETKQMEGDPKMRQRRRRIQMQLARSRMMNSVEQADVVVTNPVELAVALKYDPDNDAAPRVVAKGARLMAQQIKEIARAGDVPIYEHKPLARALFEAVEVNEYVPENLYQGVATILAYVWDVNKRKKFANA